MLSPDSIQQSIQAGLPAAEVHVSGNDGTHFEAVVICPLFQGKSLLEQHRMVYATLGNRFSEDIHALALKTYTPDTWQAKQISAD
jgi:acid stress-induced BolA-like protein IbaG/YrbA